MRQRDNLTQEIRECLRHAEECAREAAELPDGSVFRQDFLELQNRWLELARSIEFGEQLDSFTKNPRRFWVGGLLFVIIPAPPLPAALDCRANWRRIRLLKKRGDCREGVLNCLPRSDRTGCDLVGCPQPRAGARGSGICHVPLYAGWRD